MTMFSMLISAKIRRYPTQRLIRDPQVIQELLSLVPEPLVTLDRKIYWLDRIRLMTLLEACRRKYSEPHHIYDWMDLYEYIGVDLEQPEPTLLEENRVNNVIQGPWGLN